MWHGSCEQNVNSNVAYCNTSALKIDILVSVNDLYIKEKIRVNVLKFISKCVLFENALFFSDIQ